MSEEAIEHDDDLLYGFLSPCDSSPTLTRGKKKHRCNFCDSEFSLLKRKRKCRKCHNYFCSDCCCVKASFPTSYEFTKPKWACNECVTEIFNLRTAPEEIELSDSGEIKKGTGAVVDGSFYTSTDSSVHRAFKMADPVCRMVFRISGMHNGGHFDRSKLKKAMRLNKALAKLPPVGSVERHFIPVPKNITNEDWNPEELYAKPPFMNRKKRRRKRKKKEKSNSSMERIKKESRTSSDSDIGESSDGSSSSTTTQDWDSISVFVYKPKDIKEDEILPILVWYHGGGFCIGSIEDSMYEYICRIFCERIRCVVVSVEYRLAPEYQFPTQIEDCYWALLWVYHQGKKLFNGDVSRIAVAGDSAGGSISALMCILCKRRKTSPKICHQVLIYPCLANPCNDTYESQSKYKNGPLLTRKVMEWFMKSFMGDCDREPEYLFPLLFDDEEVSGLPPASIINAQHDPLRDHGTEYFKKLQRVDVPVTHTIYGKSIHGFFGSQIAESDEAMMEATIALKKAFFHDDEN